MKKLFATAAMSIALSAPAFAGSDDAMSPFVMPETSAELRASELIGMRLYTSENEIESFEANEASQDWEDIGEISDVILSRDGNVMAVMLDIGGFLGIGERTVAVNMSDLNLVSDGDDQGDFFIVVNSSKAQLEEAPEYDSANVGNWSEIRGPDAGRAIANAKMEGNEAAAETKEAMNEAEAATEQAAAEAEQTTEQAAAEAEQATEQAAAEVEETTEQAAAEVEETTEQAAAEAEQTTEQAAAEVEQETEQAAAEAEQTAEQAATETEMAASEAAVDGYAMVDATKMTADELNGAAVYDTSDEWIGEVSNIVMSDEGKINTVVVDVGGFLGIGEKPVGLDFEKIKVLRGQDGGDLRVHVNSSKEELESMPEFEG